MPRGSKSGYTSKQKRQARKIESSAKKRGASSKRAAQIGWATVNKQDGGGKKGGAAKKSAAKKSTAKTSTAKKSTAKSKPRAASRKKAS